MAKQFPFMLCCINWEIGSFVSRDEVKGTLVGGKPVYKVSFHTTSGGCSGSTILPKDPVELPYYIPEDAFKEYSFGKINKTGVPERLMVILYDQDHKSQLLDLVAKDLLKLIAEKDNLISDLSTKTATQRITVSDSNEETKKQLQILKDTNKTIEKEKTDPFDRIDGQVPLWRRP